MALDTAFREIEGGETHEQLARRIKQYLIEPDKLFRRVRNKHGKLVDSKAMASYHPGRGVYRSSYKNALRLATEEVNRALRYADWSAWQEIDHVVGFKITPRAYMSRPCDMCDHLQGVYPKSFKWYSWHVQCRCVATPIMGGTHEQIRNGTYDPTPPPMPKQYMEWVKENSQKIRRATRKGKAPYFITDNKKVVRNQLILDREKVAQPPNKRPKQESKEWIIKDKEKTLEIIKEKKEHMHQYDGEAIESKNFMTGKMTVLRRSLGDIYEHAMEYGSIRKWLQTYDIQSLKSLKYKGWAKLRKYPKDHPKYDPKNPGKLKHQRDTDWFYYYTIKIGKRDYWANVKLHKNYDEVLYTIEWEKPKDIIKERKKK